AFAPLLATAIGSLPAPGFSAAAATQHPLAENVGDDTGVAGEQRLGRAHLGAKRQLALGEAVGAVLLVFGLRAGFLGAAGAEGALVHLAARAERRGAVGELRRTEGAGEEAVAAADALVLVVQDHAVLGLVEAVGRAHRHAGCVRTVH